MEDIEKDHNDEKVMREVKSISGGRLSRSQGPEEIYEQEVRTAGNIS